MVWNQRRRAFRAVCAGFTPRYVGRVPFDESLNVTALGGRDSDVVVSAHRSALYRKKAFAVNYICREIAI